MASRELHLRGEALQFGTEKIKAISVSIARLNKLYANHANNWISGIGAAGVHRVIQYLHHNSLHAFGGHDHPLMLSQPSVAADQRPSLSLQTYTANMTLGRGSVIPQLPALTHDTTYKNSPTRSDPEKTASPASPSTPDTTPKHARERAHCHSNLILPSTPYNATATTGYHTCQPRPAESGPFWLGRFRLSCHTTQAPHSTPDLCVFKPALRVMNSIPTAATLLHVTPLSRATHLQNAQNVGLCAEPVIDGQAAPTVPRSARQYEASKTARHALPRAAMLSRASGARCNSCSTGLRSAPSFCRISLGHASHGSSVLPWSCASNCTHTRSCQAHAGAGKACRGNASPHRTCGSHSCVPQRGCKSRRRGAGA